MILEQISETSSSIASAPTAANNFWAAMVQVPQKVPHKRTFLFLEQPTLKHGAQTDTISVKEV